jgi:hypothetical protein
MQTTAFEDYVTVAALSRLTYVFEDIDSEMSRVAWDQFGRRYGGGSVSVGGL